MADADLQLQIRQLEQQLADLSKKVTLRLLGNSPVSQYARDPNAPIQATEIATNDAQVVGATWTNNSPSAGSVAWGAMVIMNNGNSYPITAGNTALQFLYWNVGDATLTGAATFVPQIDRYLIGTNVSGSLDESWNKIGNKSIVSSQIDSINANTINGLITAGQIDTITAGQITGPITASSIAAINITGSVGQIGGTLVAGQVPASFITAGMINTVNASQIAGSITAGQITSITSAQITGSITASSIAAINITGALTAGQLTLGNFDNLVEDPGFERNSAASWPSIAGAWSIVNDPANARTGNYCLKLIGTGVNYIFFNAVVADCKPGDEFYFECYGKVTAYTSGTASVGVRWLDASGTPTDSLTTISGIQAYTLLSINAVAPAGAVKVKLVFGCSLVGTAYFDDFYLKRKVSGSGIVNATITAAHIGSVSASTITGTITSSQIASVAASTITGSITSSQIGSVAASTITGTLTSGQIASVSASTISGSITAGQITSITAGQITGTITASSIAATGITGLIQAAQINTITSGQITGSITASSIAAVNITGSVGSIGGTLSSGQVPSSFITAAMINTVNSSQIAGLISASQIGSVFASTISGALVAGQITSITAGQITGSITGSQIGSVTITAANIANLTITAGNIANTTITEAKLAFSINSPYKPVAASSISVFPGTVSGSNTYADVINVTEQGLLVSVGFRYLAATEDPGNSGSVVQQIGINIDGQGEQLFTVHTFSGGSTTDGAFASGFQMVSTDHEGVGGAVGNYIVAAFGIPYNVSLRVRHGYTRSGTSATNWNQYQISALRAQKI